MSLLDDKIKEKIKQAIISLDPDAEAYIYGSRARGDASAESDWDVMVITPHTVTPQLKRSIRHALYEIEWDNGCVISSIVRSRREWDTTQMRMTPFYRNVTRDAVRI
jgi:predicted nucleotidyltransferase